MIHHRRVMLRPQKRMIEVEDWIAASAPQHAALSYHLGPSVQVALDGRVARLSWIDGSGQKRHCAARSCEQLDWTVHRGEVNPPLGWYSAGFGEKEPTSVLVGRGEIEPNLRLRMRLAWSLSRPANQSNVPVEAGISQ